MGPFVTWIPNSLDTYWAQCFYSEKDKDIVMFDVSSMVEIIMQITMDVRSTKTYKRKHTHLSGWNNTLLPHKSNMTYTLNQE
jgi:hypothetical protein